MAKNRIAVIGAGPAGMTAAYMLAKQGQAVEVFEAESVVGGMAKTFVLWGQRVDLGPHRFFSSDARVNALWLEAIGRDYRMVDRQTRIFYDGKFFDYPLKAGNALSNLGPIEAARCVFSYAKQRGRPTRHAEGSFEHWVTQRFGARLFEIFFKTYTEKLWGIASDKLDADFAAQRIKKLSLFEAVKTSIFPDRTGTHRTLVDKFAYPKLGTGQVYENMAATILSCGGEVHLSTPVKKVHAEKNQTHAQLELNDGTRREFSQIISSMPLTRLVRQLPDLPQDVVKAVDALRFRNTILVYLRVEHDHLFDDNWLYVHAKDLRMGRITNFRNWVPELYGDDKHTILALEYWCFDDEPFWQQSDEALIELATSEIETTGLTRGAPIKAGHVKRVPKCYPVYDRGYQASLARVQGHLDLYPAVTAIGRYGAFKYNNQDHSILMGILAAENIALAAEHDLWAINTDYTYQEQAFISETGLVAAGPA